jgi:hypothetical protein
LVLCLAELAGEFGDLLRDQLAVRLTLIVCWAHGQSLPVSRALIGISEGK